MHIRKGLSTDLARLECCDFSFTVDEIAREPFLNGDLHIVNVSACLFYRHYGFILGGYDRYLYNALPEKDEVALFWYYMLA